MTWRSQLRSQTPFMRELLRTHYTNLSQDPGAKQLGIQRDSDPTGKQNYSWNVQIYYLEDKTSLRIYRDPLLNLDLDPLLNLDPEFASCLLMGTVVGLGTGFLWRQCSNCVRRRRRYDLHFSIHATSLITWLSFSFSNKKVSFRFKYHLLLPQI